jgi:hypothetical protein
MSKRNFILLIIILILIVAVVFAFLFLRPDGTTPGDTGPGTNFFSQFNPFGTKPTPPPPPPPVDVSGYVPPDTMPAGKLVKISSMPVAGFAVFLKERLKEVPILPPTSEVTTPPKKVAPPPTEFMPALRYVDKANGNIYQTFADKIEERKFSSTIIPKVYEAYFGNRGETVVMRYLKADDRTIETFVGNLPREVLGADTTGTNEVKGSFLPNNIKDISLSPDTSKIFYLFNSGDMMVGTILNFLNNRKTQIFDSPFTEWSSSWPNNNIITLSTKPSANVPGYMYTMDSAGKNLSRVLSQINGLTDLMSPNGKLVIYNGNNSSSNLPLNVYNKDTRNSFLLGVRTLPEKCVWGRIGDSVYCAVPKSVSPGQYPDTWYQGEVSFSDQLWKIDAVTGNATLLADPATISGGEEIDGIKLALDEGENYLFFVNKKDSFLWKLDLK